MGSGRSEEEQLRAIRPREDDQEHGSVCNVGGLLNVMYESAGAQGGFPGPPGDDLRTMSVQDRVEGGVQYRTHLGSRHLPRQATALAVVLGRHWAAWSTSARCVPRSRRCCGWKQAREALTRVAGRHTPRQDHAADRAAGPDILGSCLVLRVRSQDSAPVVRGWVSMPTQREEDEAKIRQQVDKIVEGIRAKDLEGLRRLYATDVVSFDVEPPLQHVGIEAKLKNWAKVFTFFEDVDYEVRDLAVTVGDDVAFGHAFGRLSGTLKDGTATSGMWVRGTFCFQKLDRNWLIVHDQASVPFDIVSGKGVTDLEP